MARVNAAAQWTLPLISYPHMDPDMRAEALVASVRFFDLYYLHPDPEQDFDPQFYDDDPMVTPGFHWEICRQWARSDTNIAIAPRGAAKSFLVRKVSMLRMLTRPMYTIIYATSTSDNAESTGLSLKLQFTGNQRIIDDFSSEFPDGYITPKRGESKFATNFMVLKNGSWLRSISAESRMRGGRPRRFVLDDPEYDPKASTSMALIRQYMESLLFKMVLPMVMRPGCGVDWLATFVSRRHYAWHALAVDEVTKQAVDPRFNRWSRYVVRAAVEDPSDPAKLISCWPDMWPATEEDKKANPRLADRKSLEEIRETIGTPNFLAEYMARPGEGDAQHFGILTPEKHGYSITDADDALETKPCGSEAKINWLTSKNVARSMSLREFCKSARLFMTVDTSYTATKDSDYKVACLMCVNSDKDLFVLDLWAAQCQEQELIRAAFAMADRWHCPSIHIEAIRDGLGLYQTMDSLSRTRDQEMMGVGFVPAIKKLNPGSIEKRAKIATLGLRFEFGRIKLPLFRKNKRPWSMLFEQIEGFNPDAPDGGLHKDDCLDSVSMSSFIVKGRVRALVPEEEKKLGPIERLKRGEMRDESGVLIAHGLNFHEIPLQDLAEIFKNLSPDRSQIGGSKA